jgi:hypothetical protein
LSPLGIGAQTFPLSCRPEAFDGRILQARS